MNKSLCLRIQNKQTKRDTLIMYPCNKYEILQALCECQLPYGTSDYTHLVPYENQKIGEFERTMIGIIENVKYPPSIRELNYLATQIQSMSDDALIDFKSKIKEMSNITEAINITHSLLSDDVVYDEIPMAERSVVLGENEPYIRIKFLSSIDELYSEEPSEGVWIDLPAQKEDFEVAAQKLGLDSVYKLIIGKVQTYSNQIFECFFEDDSPFIDNSKINDLAQAMKDNLTPQQLFKYEAVMEMEQCFDDYEKAIEITKNLNKYIFFTEQELFDRYKYIYDDLDYKKLEEIALDIGLENTWSGYITDGTIPVFEPSLNLNL